MDKTSYRQLYFSPEKVLWSSDTPFFALQDQSASLDPSLCKKHVN